MGCKYVCVPHQDSVEKDRKIRQLSASLENEKQKMETELCSTRFELGSVKQESVAHCLHHPPS